MNTQLATIARTSQETMLQSARVQIRSRGNKYIEANVVFDTGADRSYVSSKFVKKSKSQSVMAEWLAFAGFGDEAPSAQELRAVHALELSDGTRNICRLEIPEVGRICAPILRKKLPEQATSAFEGLKLADNYDEDRTYEIDVLIGNDFIWDLVDPKQSVRWQLLMAMYTPFGYVVSGAWTTKDIVSPTRNVLISARQLSTNGVERFWNLDGIGIVPDEVEVDSVDSHPAMKHFNRHLEYSAEERRYQVACIFKSERHPTVLKNNCSMVHGRVNALHKKLEKEGLTQEYMDIMQGYYMEGMFEFIPDDEIPNPSCYYMPQHAVIKRDENGTKLRPVFDLSVKGPNGVSCNDIMVAGPALQPDIVGLTVRWRR